jgi:membrane protein DedA with SNARE-associated domain
MTQGTVPTTPELPGPLAALAPFLEHYGYLAVAVLVLLDNAALPVPGQTVLILAAVYAGAGRLSLAGVVVVAVVAAFLGDCLGYWLGRSGGRALVHRWGRFVGLTGERLERAEGFFTRNGGRVVLGARFIDGLRQTNGIIAGTTGMPWRRFLLWNALGAIAWVGVWATVGYLAGGNIDEIYRQALRYQLYLLFAALALVAALVVRSVLRRRRRS